MYVKRAIDPKIIYYFSWRAVLVTTVLSSTVYCLYHFLQIRALSIPFLPIATLGTAVAFTIGFKNNSSYDRLWEGRKIWGELTNISRAASAYLLAAIRTDEGKTAATRFVYRQIAYVNLVRAQLRRRNVWDEADIYTRMAITCFENKPFEQEREEILSAFCSKEEAESLRSKQSPAQEVLNLQMQALSQFKERGWVDPYECSDLMHMCAELYAQQGKAERIKTFPFPRQYAFFSEVFVFIFMGLLPFGLIGEFAKLSESQAWLTIPFSVLISFVFFTMEKVGDTSENPFEGGLNDVPMTAICRTIEIDLKQMLKETEIPQPIQAVDYVLI